MDDWVCYIIINGKCSYVGVTNNAVKRLRAHNGEIIGGAKYTRSKGPGWEHVCIIHGFPTKIESMQFEWAVKHEAPRNKGGPIARTQKLYSVLRKPRWTSKAPDAHQVPLTIEWMIPLPTKELPQLPLYVKQLKKCTNNELSTGTIINPPPMPNNPAKKPTTQPNSAQLIIRITKSCIVHSYKIEFIIVVFMKNFFI